MGAAKRAETLKQNKGDDPAVLSPGDKTAPAPKHDTRAEIAAKVGKSTGWVGMADVGGCALAAPPVVNGYRLDFRRVHLFGRFYANAVATRQKLGQG